MLCVKKLPNTLSWNAQNEVSSLKSSNIMLELGLQSLREINKALFDMNGAVYIESDYMETCFVSTDFILDQRSPVS